MNISNTNRGARMRRLALLAGAGLCCVGAAWAAPPQDASVVTRSETVKYHPAEVATAEGAARLYQTLRRTAQRVCESPSPFDKHLLQVDPSYASCVRGALDDAVRQVGLPMVTVLHQYGPSAAMASRR